MMQNIQLVIPLNENEKYLYGSKSCFLLKQKHHLTTQLEQMTYGAIKRTNDNSF